MCIKVTGKLTVYFEPPFWVGVYENVIGGKIATSKMVFGAEPKDYEIHEFVLNNYYQLKFSKPIPLSKKPTEKRINPKRLQKQIRKQTTEIGIGTKAQQAIKAEYEANKLGAKKISKMEKEKAKEEKYLKKQAKKKLKKRGH